MQEREYLEALRSDDTCHRAETACLVSDAVASSQDPPFRLNMKNSPVRAVQLGRDA